VNSFLSRLGRHQRGAAAGRSDRYIDVDRMSYEELLILEEKIGEVKKRGLESNQIESITTCFHFVCNPNAESESCSVCLMDFEEKQNVRKLPCEHFYHKECIDKWLAQKGSCPVCKAELCS